MPRNRNGQRKRPRITTFSTYIYKVLKQVHPDTGLSNQAMAIMNDFVQFTLRRLAEQAQILVDIEKAKTVDSRVIQTAVRLEFPGELAKHAVSEGTKAVTKFNAARGTKGSQSVKSGLQFPVSRCKALLRKYTSVDRIATGAPVYLAAVCEYMTAEVLELAGNASKDLKVRRITPRHITLAVRGDEELDNFLQDITIRGGGVIPHIHAALVRGIKSDGPSFGAAPSSFTFGGSAPVQGFGMTTAAPMTGFGMTTAAPMTGFGMTTAAPMTGFGMTTAAPMTTAFGAPSAFSFGTSTTTAPTGFNFGGTASKGGFSFGTQNPIPNFGALNINDEEEDEAGSEDE